MSSQPNQPPGKRPTRAKKLWSAIKASFRWAEKISPVIEAIGVIAIPLVIWFATQSAQEAKDNSEKAARAQEAVKTYLNQLSTAFLDGSLEKDERLRTVTRASTLALFNDPNLDGGRKGQVIEYLTELKLVQIEVGDPQGSKKPLVSLASSSLNNAVIEGKNLRGADLSEAKLNGASLFATDLSGADLSRAELKGADLTVTRLEGTNLVRADLSGATIINFIGKYTNFVGISGATLCETKLPSLPEGIELDPNRDCKKLGITP